MTDRPLLESMNDPKSYKITKVFMLSQVALQTRQEQRKSKSISWKSLYPSFCIFLSNFGKPSLAPKKGWIKGRTLHMKCLCVRGCVIIPPLQKKFVGIMLQFMCVCMCSLRSSWLLKTRAARSSEGEQLIWRRKRCVIQLFIWVGLHWRHFLSSYGPLYLAWWLVLYGAENTNVIWRLLIGLCPQCTR